MSTVRANEASGNGDVLRGKVAWFPYMKAPKPVKRIFGQVLDDIQNGKWRAKVERLRAILAKDGEDAYDKAKVRLPSFYATGAASTPRKMLTHTGCLPIDLDDLGDRLEEVRG